MKLAAIRQSPVTKLVDRELRESLKSYPVKNTTKIIFGKHHDHRHSIENQLNSKR